MAVIEKARPEHLDDITRIWIDLMNYHAEFDRFFEMSPDAVENFRYWMAGEIERDESCVLVAIEDERITGYAGSRINFHPPVFSKVKHLLVTDMIVEPDCRNKGTGTALVNGMMRWARERGLDRVELGVAPGNPIGIRFWQKMGFRDYMHMVYREP